MLYYRGRLTEMRVARTLGTCAWHEYLNIVLGPSKIVGYEHLTLGGRYVSYGKRGGPPFFFGPSNIVVDWYRRVMCVNSCRLLS